MARLTRYTQKLFGSNASSNQMAEFGSLAASAPARYSGSTITPAIVQGLANYLTGWFGAVVGLNSPAIEDMNSLCYLFAYQLAYILQAGMPEWDSGTTYYTGDLVQVSGTIYQSLIDSNLNNNPATDKTNWFATVSDEVKLLTVSNWLARTPAASNSWNGLAFGSIGTGQNLFVAVSSDGANRVMVSDNGIDWTAASASEANSWRSVVFGGTLFVAVSSDGTHRVMTSSNGTVWTNQTAAEANQWESVTYGNALYVAVAQSGTHRVMTSPDGNTWTARTAAEANGWQAVTYGNALYVAVSADGTHRVMTSPDGTTWTARTAASASTWVAVAYGNGLYVATGGAGAIMTSPDGTTWTTRTDPGGGHTDWNAVIYANGIWVAVGDSGTAGASGNIVMTSLDGITWTLRTGPSNTWAALAFGKSVFVSVSNGVTSSGPMTSMFFP